MISHAKIVYEICIRKLYTFKFIITCYKCKFYYLVTSWQTKLYYVLFLQQKYCSVGASKRRISWIQAREITADMQSNWKYIFRLNFYEQIKERSFVIPLKAVEQAIILKLVLYS